MICCARWMQNTVFGFFRSNSATVDRHPARGLRRPLDEDRVMLGRNTACGRLQCVYDLPFAIWGAELYGHSLERACDVHLRPQLRTRSRCSSLSAATLLRPQSHFSRQCVLPWRSRPTRFCATSVPYRLPVMSRRSSGRGCLIRCSCRHPQLRVAPLRTLLRSTVTVLPQSHRHSQRRPPLRRIGISRPNFLPSASLLNRCQAKA